MQVSCSYLPPQVGSQMRMAYQGVSGIVFGYEDYPITQAMVDNIPYASMRMKIGKGGAGFLILKEKNLWRPHGLMLLADYFASKGETIKAIEFYQEIFKIKNLHINLYNHAKSQLSIIAND